MLGAQTTLMKAIADQKVDGFPPKDVLRTVYAEHEIKPELADLSVVDYVFADEVLKGLPILPLPLGIRLSTFSPSRDTQMFGPWAWASTHAQMCLISEGFCRMGKNVGTVAIYGKMKFLGLDSSIVKSIVPSSTARSRYGHEVPPPG